MSMDVWLEVEAKEFVVIKEMVGVVDCPWERRCVCTASQLAARPCDSRSCQNSKQIALCRRCLCPLHPLPLVLARARNAFASPFPSHAVHHIFPIRSKAWLSSPRRRAPATVEQTNPPLRSRKRLAGCLPSRGCAVPRHSSVYLAYETCFMTIRVILIVDMSVP